MGRPKSWRHPFSHKQEDLANLPTMEAIPADGQRPSGRGGHGGRHAGGRGRGRGSRGGRGGRGRGRHANNNNQRQSSSPAKSKPCCVVCGSDDGRYKCPKCREPYCSVKCCREHKEKCPVLVAAAAADAEDSAPAASRKRRFFRVGFIFSSVVGAVHKFLFHCVLK